MNNHDICRFINSKDIRAYLDDIQYPFTTVEAAWLVYQCRNATLEEKFYAWEDIVNTMPDQPVDSRQFLKPYKSIHKIIGEYMKFKKKIKDEFFTEDADHFYRHAVKYTGEPLEFDGTVPSKTFRGSFEQLKAEIINCPDASYGCVRRTSIRDFSSITAICNADGDSLDYEYPTSLTLEDSDIAEFYENLWFHFPVPYEKGDILFDPLHVNSGICSGPVVMTGITPWKYAEDKRELWDTSDMNVWGYFQSEYSGKIYAEVTHNYMDYELCPEEELFGKRRILKTISNYIKGKIGLDLLINAYHIIMLEEELNNSLDFSQMWTEQARSLAGIAQNKKGN